MSWFRTMTLGLVASALLTSTGCSLLHNLKPHRLWRMNRATNGMHTDAYFSVADPIPEPQRDANETAELEPERIETSGHGTDAQYARQRAKRAAVHEKLEDVPCIQSLMMVNPLD